ncbi:polysaccharide biosynthesis/export family protein [Desulfonema magnum]|uniref:Polysaccharide export protein n=1 Tax=Desulfonema magnum TaxID=45655 RepID=A0A975BR18_9BACT|nr:polysaccharide biosynthesis/export family protein [Desulfonema magnum]QTA89990.1 Putative polysaccharide export protein [Desulfonema magnum]
MASVWAVEENEFSVTAEQEIPVQGQVSEISTMTEEEISGKHPEQTSELPIMTEKEIPEQGPEQTSEFPMATEEEILPDQGSKKVSDVAEGWPRPPYIIGSGDVLYISVWKNNDMTRLATVLPDGKVSFPLIGEILAAGKTAAQLKKELEARISPRFILEPVLSVEVQQVNSMLIYIIGKVNNPGRFALNTNINVLQALSMAGGLNPFAKRNKIKIFREEGDQTKIFEFRYDDVSDGIHLEQNIRLKRADVIVVP